MRRIAVCDAETDPFKRNRVPAPFIWGWYDGDEYLCFRTTEELVSHLSAFDGIVYAHNGGRFDWHFLLPYAEAYDEIMLINGRIAKMHIGACELRDSYNIIPVPLSAYKKDDIDYSIMEPDVRDLPCNMRKIKKYLKSDCIYLYELVTRFISDYGMQMTQAGAAMKQWTKISNLPTPSTDKNFYDEISAYYYGGRVQCFQSGIIERLVSVSDINSAYPYAMLHKHPYSSNYSQREGYAENADFYKVRCISRGAFPFRGLGLSDGRTAAGLAFPDDDVPREYTITKWEYAAAIETNTIECVEVLESISFMGHQDFSEYVNYFYELRNVCKANDDVAGSLFAKLFMNSLYGKFAANPAAYSNYMIVPMNVIAGLPATGWKFSGEFGPWGLAEAPLEEDRQRYYNVATGASITGFVRAMLWRAICASKGVIYCDTDSITAESASVVYGGNLGQWKHEGNFDRCGIAGKKLYIMRGANGWYEDSDGKTLYSPTVKPAGCERLYKTASKGAKLTRSQLWHVAKGGNVEHVAEAPTFSPKKEPVFTNRKIRFTAPTSTIVKDCKESEDM